MQRWFVSRKEYEKTIDRIWFLLESKQAQIIKMNSLLDSIAEAVKEAVADKKATHKSKTISKQRAVGPEAKPRSRENDSWRPNDKREAKSLNKSSITQTKKKG